MREKRLEGRYLIVGGATKAATTSVFFYLAEHPDICRASLKEPRFFLDVDYPVRSSHRLEVEGPEKYLDFYAHCGDEAVRMEATPDYLHSPGTAGRIARHLPGARMVFLLREPVSRLESWYRFARQDGMIPGDMDFAAFVRAQAEGDEVRSAPQHLRALDQGRYARDLRRYVEALGCDRIHVAFFEDLVEDPRPVVEEICRFAGLDPTPLADLVYRVHNPTRATRMPWLHAAYKRFRYSVRQVTHSRPVIQGFLRRLRAGFERIYWRLNASGADELDVPPDVHAYLCEYYGDPIGELGKMLSAPLPDRWTGVHGERRRLP